MPTTQGRPQGEGQGSVFQQVSRKLIFRGVDLAHPPDRLTEGKYPCAKNLRAYVDGEVRSRPGLSNLLTLPTGAKVHSLFRLSDPATGDYTFIIGAGDQLYVGKTAGEVAAALETGFSQNPLTSVVVRPDRAPSNWTYLADSLKMRKVSVARTLRTWGIPELPAVPSFSTTPPLVLQITNADNLTQDGNTWNNSVNAGALSTAAQLATTISTILYDSGTTGYCAIAPAAMGVEIQPGLRIRVNSGGGSDEYIVVEQVFAPIASTTIESISYDSGVGGLAWIQLANPTAGLVPGCIVKLGGVETVKVLEVILDKDNKAAIRANVTTTRIIGDAVTGFRAFRAYCANNHLAGESLGASYIQSTITYPGTAPKGVGNIRLNAARDLSKFSTRQVTDDDEVVILLYLSDASKLTQGRVWFDLDPNTTSSYQANDLSRNYLFFPFRPEDLQAYAAYDTSQTQVSATGQNIQRYQFDLFNTTQQDATGQDSPRTISQVGGILRGHREQLQALGVGEGGGLSTASSENPGAYQAGSGKEQWFTLRFKLGQMSRVGQNTSLTLKDCTSVMVNFNMSADAQVVRLSSWYISGGSNPDMKGSDDLRANAYYYVVQGRDSTTGARSLPGPITRAGLVARRQLATINLTQHPNAQVDKLDVYRWGGSLHDFRLVGTADNGPSPSITDNNSDSDLQNAPLLNFNTFPPFATVTLPFTCQVDVVGPKVMWRSGSKFDTRWSPGTYINIAGKTYILYTSPSSDSVLYLTQSAGTQTNVKADINSPVVIGNPLPTVFGPYALSGGVFVFACGDTLNPTSLYWTNGNDPDTTSDQNYVEVPSNGSELVGGCIYDGRPFIFSADQMFEVTPDGSGNPGASLFRANPIANSRGAVASTAIDSDVYIYFVGKDGIYISEGGQPVSITNDSLYPIFPHDGVAGTTVNGIVAPDYTRVKEFHLNTYGPYCYFDYPGIDGQFHTLIWDNNLKGWLVDEYSLLGLGGTIHLGERGQGNFRLLLGGENGTISSMQGFQDISAPIAGEIWMPCFDAGDERSRKVFGDQVFDIDTGGIPVTVQTWLDNFTSLAQTDNISTAQRDIALVDFSAGDEYDVRNIAQKIFFSTSTGVFKLYSAQLSFYTQVEDIILRAPDWDYGNKVGAEWFQGVLITADTEGQDVAMRAEFDQGAATKDFTINHNGFVEKYYSFVDPNVIAHHARLRQIGTSQKFRNFNVNWVTESYPESSPNWASQPQGSEMPGWKHIREGWITYVSTADATFSLVLDETITYTWKIPSSAGKKAQFYLPLIGRKCRIWQPKIDCPNPFTLFEKDTIFSVGLWGRQDSYKPMRPFGGPNSDNLSQAYV